MASRNLDWVMGHWSEYDPGDGMLDSFTVPLDGTLVTLQLIADADLADHQDDIIVERVIGQYLLNCTLATTSSVGYCAMRMAVRPEDPGAAILSTWQAPITSAVMADEKFMWHKQHILNHGTRNLAPDVHPEWSTLDVRVNRRLQELERLCLMFQGTTGGGFSATSSMTCQAWIRVLCKTP